MNPAPPAPTIQVTVQDDTSTQANIDWGLIEAQNDRGILTQADVEFRKEHGIEYAGMDIEGAPSQPAPSPPAPGMYGGPPIPGMYDNPPRRPRRYQRHRACSVSPNYRGRNPLPRHVLQQRNHRPFYVSSNYRGNNPKPPHELKRRNYQPFPTFYY